MPSDASKRFIIGMSSRALFDLSREDRIFEEQGLEAYSAFQLSHECEPLAKGAGYQLAERVLRLNDNVCAGQCTEVVVMSKNSADTSLRLFHSIRHYNLDITRAAMSGGRSLAPYLSAFSIDLFLSASREDVQAAASAGVAAGMIYSAPVDQNGKIDELRIAFDGDAVLFSDEAEIICREQGLQSFLDYEVRNAQKPLLEGPFAKVLRAIATLQDRCARNGTYPIRTALVTARSSPAHERVVRTLRAWNVGVDEAFFMGGTAKDEILKAFGAHIFFDDQDSNCLAASKVVPTAQVFGR